MTVRCAGDVFESDQASDLRHVLVLVEHRLRQLVEARGHREDDRAVVELVGLLIARGRYSDAYDVTSRASLSSPLVEVAWCRVRLALDALEAEERSPEVVPALARCWLRRRLIGLVSA